MAGNNNTINVFYTSFYRLANCIRWKEHNEVNNATITDETTICTACPKTNYIKKPESTTTLEDSLRRVHREFPNIIQTIQKRPKWSNLTVKKRHVLENLKKKNNIYPPGDKGGEFCVIDSLTYSKAATQHLDDPTTYRKVACMTAKTIVVIYCHYNPTSNKRLPFVDIPRGFGGEKQSRVVLGAFKTF